MSTKAQEIADKVQAWHATDHEDEGNRPQCAMCHAGCMVPADLEPTPLCNLCAQEAVETLLDAVRVLTAEGDAARAEVERLNGQLAAVGRDRNARSAALFEMSKAWSPDDTWDELRWDQGMVRMAKEHTEILQDLAAEKARADRLGQWVSGLPRFGVAFHPDHGDQLTLQDDGPVVYLSDVLRLLDEPPASKPIPAWYWNCPKCSRAMEDNPMDRVRVPPAEETSEQYIARLRKEVDERRADLDKAMSRTSLYDHEQEMLEASEVELAEALKSAAEK